MAMVTKNMLISEILELDETRGIANILMQHGMRCIGCPSAKNETLEQAAGVHGMSADELLEEINNYLQGVKLA